ncbi:MAG: sigma 54-interacting transcriptional regulator [Candidatus Rokuibacteriota bacterium]
MSSAHDASAVLADLVACLAAIGRSMHDAFDPRKFLEEFSVKLQRLTPHDRLAIAFLDDDRRTFTIFAEHAAKGPVLHEAHYTTGFSPAGRYPIGHGALAAMFGGGVLRLEELRDDYGFAVEGSVEHVVREAGFRSALLLPLYSGGLVIGGLVASSLTPGAYSAAHAATGRQVADLIAPFVQNVVRLQRERRRNRRLRDLDALGPALAASLDVKDVFDRLAEAVRPALDFDVMGICLFSSSGRELERLVEVDSDPPAAPTPWRMDLDSFSFADKIRAAETILVTDAAVELDPKLSGDRLMLDGGARSAIGAPLLRGGMVAGALYFGKRRPYWFDADDAEIARYVATGVVLALQHQRLADEQRRLVAVEGKARQLQARLESLRESLDERYGFDRIIGRSPVLRAALARAAKVAPTETTVLITGESGTGKEVVARAIHQASGRAEGPFLAVNCAALPEALLESELFGHERGAFTGADRQKPGRFELAAGGTLFLDEVAEMTPPVQAKLLRVLQEREFQRVGGTVTLKTDARVIAATNRDLEQAVSTGRLREDLFYRLNVFAVPLPPLRERGDDVLLLADHFVRALGFRMGKGEAGLSRDAREALLAHRWPGNIRELQNAVERALIVSDGGLITAAELGIVARAPADAGSSARSASTLPPATSLAESERRMVADALAKARGNKSRAAKALGLTRAQLYTRMKRFGLD